MLKIVCTLDSEIHNRILIHFYINLSIAVIFREKKLINVETTFIPVQP